jgi:hypothetical protein
MNVGLVKAQESGDVPEAAKVSDGGFLLHSLLDDAPR